jgi:thioredoxin reductase (NADPH)
MKKPVIFGVDDDPLTLSAVLRDLRKQFNRNYRVMGTTSIREALDTLVEIKKKNESVAALISDQRMPEMLGVEFLSLAKEIFPDAKKILLTAYSDIDAAIKAINNVRLDYYLVKPWDPPEEKLYPVLQDLLDDWQNNFVPEFEGIKIIGYQWSPASHHIKDFLTGNLIPYKWIDLQNNKDANELLDLHQIDIKDLPVAIFEDGTFLKNPEPTEIANKIGLRSSASEQFYDVVIIGAGPAGLAAAVYGGSEGLKTLLIEKKAPGGQAGTSSRIENYLGFPSGLSGADLTRRAVTQATRFGVEFLSPCEVVDIHIKDNYKILTLSNKMEVKTHTVILTTGVDYRKLDVKGIAELTGAGVYYGSTASEAHSCRDKHVYVVGGGNSAGQAAMYLSRYSKNVFVVIRKNSLVSTMSHYLIKQIEQTGNISILTNSIVKEAIGVNQLECLVLENLETGELKKVAASALFIFIGAKPVTEWISIDIYKDSKGFIETGQNLFKHEHFTKSWKLKRDPYLLETCIPGVFSAGDVRAGAMNRVASAVGEGSMAIKFVHEYLAEV